MAGAWEVTPLPVFFDARQSVVGHRSFSPSAGKPAQVVARWQAHARPIRIAPVAPVAPADFYRVHDRRYVDDVLQLRRTNGFGDCSPEVAQALPWTTGSLVSALRHVVAHGGHACSPTSGFHHAEFARGMGFCTFNGLMVAADIALDELGCARIGILDLDMHDANGTADILQHRGQDGVLHYSFGTSESDAFHWAGGGPAEAWLARLPQIVERFRGCAAVLYQAGADPHVDDPFGGALTTAQLRRRDRIVFQTLAAVPLVWNLAGGYQQPLEQVLLLHDATLEECLAARP